MSANLTATSSSLTDDLRPTCATPVLAVVGSRNFKPSLAMIRLAILRTYKQFELPKPQAFCTGDANGVDATFAQYIERMYKLKGEEPPLMQFPAYWWTTDLLGHRHYNKAAGVHRTIQMLDTCKPTVIAITRLDNPAKPEPTPGTAHTLRLAHQRKLPLFWYTWDRYEGKLMGMLYRNAKRKEV